jgi:hypothetical protein
MQDSPLSVTASITGILTFVAALCAAIYVRYTTLRNTREEISKTDLSIHGTMIDRRHADLAANYDDADNDVNL